MKIFLARHLKKQGARGLVENEHCQESFLSRQEGSHGCSTFYFGDSDGMPLLYWSII